MNALSVYLSDDNVLYARYTLIAPLELTFMTNAWRTFVLCIYNCRFVQSRVLGGARETIRISAVHRTPLNSAILARPQSAWTVKLQELRPNAVDTTTFGEDLLH